MREIKPGKGKYFLASLGSYFNRCRSGIALRLNYNVASSVKALPSQVHNAFLASKLISAQPFAHQRDDHEVRDEGETKQDEHELHVQGQRQS